MKTNFTKTITGITSVIILIVSFKSNVAAQYATQTLNNLTSPTSINQNLLPNKDSAKNLGSKTKGWRDIYFRGTIYHNGLPSVLFKPNYSTGLGDYALYQEGSLAQNNTGAGYGALYRNYGSYNTAIGTFSLDASSTGSYNTASGYKALFWDQNGSNNTATGALSLDTNSSGTGNSAFGYASLFSNRSGNYNTAIGDQSLYSNKDGINNSALGFASLYSNVSGSYNTAVGLYSLYDNISSENTAVGYASMQLNYDGAYNTAVGKDALYSNKSGMENTAIGHGSMFANTTGSQNTAIGRNSLHANTTGQQNTALGFYALTNNADGGANTAVGYQALNSAVGAYANTALGMDAGYNQTGGANTDVGYNAGPATTSSGNYNTSLGWSAKTAANVYSSTAIGAKAATTASYQVRVGDNTTTSIGGYVNWSNISDGRVKKNIKQNVPGLAFINKLNPVTYNLDLDAADRIIQITVSKDKDSKFIQPSQQEIAARKAKEQVVYTGFVAQDVEKVAKSLNYDFSGVDAAKNDHDLYGLRYADFVVPLVKAVQELSQQNDSLKSQNYIQQKINADLQNQINDLRALIVSNQSTINTQLSTASLNQNIPNPFNHSTTVNYSLPQTYSSAKIIVSDKGGKSLKQINISGKTGSVNIDASTLASGAYQYSLYVDGRLIDAKQMVLAK